MARLFELLLCLLPILTLLHLFFAPYTKVEESFNIQAAHDILTYGIPSENISEKLRVQYDHFTFPGAVPRTFIGALVLAEVSRPLMWLSPLVDRQSIVRAVLGLFNSFALVVYARGVAKAYGRTAGIWYTAFQASQFHVVYYASRTLPNMFAFGISTLALRFLLPDVAILSNQERRSKRLRLSLYLLTLAGIIFRSELAVLLFTTTSFLYITGQITIRREILPAAMLGVVIGLFLTVSVDSYFWQDFPLWPELASFRFNLISGNASSWGVSPVYYYFTTALPRLLLNPMTYGLCIPFALSQPGLQSSTTSLLLPSLNFMVLYSLLPHKEWRFIVYVVPPITAAAAIGASGIWLRSTKIRFHRVLSGLLIISVLLSFILSTFILLPLSTLNYPGGEALGRLHKQALASPKKILAVHMDNLACQTGVTHFLEFPPPRTLLSTDDSDKTDRMIIYDKTEDEELLLTPAFWDRFDYVLAEKPEKVIGAWEVVDSVDGFTGAVLLRAGAESWTARVAKRCLDTLPGKGVGVSEIVASAYLAFETVMRKHVTRGWWLGVKMEPKIRVLRKATLTVV